MSPRIALVLASLVFLYLFPYSQKLNYLNERPRVLQREWRVMNGWSIDPLFGGLAFASLIAIVGVTQAYPMVPASAASLPDGALPMFQSGYGVQNLGNWLGNLCTGRLRLRSAMHPPALRRATLCRSTDLRSDHASCSGGDSRFSLDSSLCEDSLGLGMFSLWVPDAYV
ncbi:MAG: hypothetical protein GY725_19495, partial [bacterium]|nr:hypothetical protein [bacterium]